MEKREHGIAVGAAGIVAGGRVDVEEGGGHFLAEAEGADGVLGSTDEGGGVTAEGGGDLGFHGRVEVFDVGEVDGFGRGDDLGGDGGWFGFLFRGRFVGCGRRCGSSRYVGSDGLEVTGAGGVQLHATCGRLGGFGSG